ncbi:MAG: DUF2867 domain-containing protein [Candidatus Thorarchaeota archaeon]|jgi:uncharacterized protein YbjT (DUF2867 family)
MSDLRRVLVVGSTGYIGTRLVSALLQRKFEVHAGFKNSAKIEMKTWSSHPNLTPMKADVFDVESLTNAAEGCAAAYYLVHSMYGKGDFVSLDREAANNLVKAAEQADLKRIIYLGGLGEAESGLSKHLASRMEVSRILHSSSVPSTTLRAAMIVGAGSASFEIMRYLVDRLPAMVTPRWVRTKSQPIAVSNVIRYLIDCLEKPETANHVYDIGGPDILSYHDLMRIYSEEAGLTRRFIVPIPILTPRLSSYWLSLVTPLPTPLTKPLIEGLRNEAICQNSDIQSIVPQKLLTVREAIRLALQQDKEATYWTRRKLPTSGAILEQVQKGDPHWAGGSSYWLTWKSKVPVSRSRVWNAIQSIIGTKGWKYGSWIWPIRGYIDNLLGGKGMGESTKHLSLLKSGSLVDCWELVELVPNSRLTLMSTLKMPAMMSFAISTKTMDPQGCEVVVELYYRPYGLAGLISWYGLLPFRKYSFGKLIDRILKSSKSEYEI